VHNWIFFLAEKVLLCWYSTVHFNSFSCIFTGFMFYRVVFVFYFLNTGSKFKLENKFFLKCEFYCLLRLSISMNKMVETIKIRKRIDLGCRFKSRWQIWSPNGLAPKSRQKGKKIPILQKKSKIIDQNLIFWAILTLFIKL
jgi:hypothetical protein